MTIAKREKNNKAEGPGLALLRQVRGDLSLSSPVVFPIHVSGLSGQMVTASDRIHREVNVVIDGLKEGRYNIYLLNKLLQFTVFSFDHTNPDIS
ncbi:hypothetical protein [Endozoicomonas montiporae]|uniref:Uncharacterized protein n=1 Tax=Endozoicomonas montiporae CL-33 TaxID=570277 RepID=A0A142BEN4_9GAMM|nr:hypothetical protein [Endozoicomonas montiporae]AMO57210.1 hypothetical protein EZMO1_3206 [Endozoicomonas montiporae CL-33]